MLRVETIATEELGDRSYVVHDGRQAVVVDPQRDTDRIEARLSELGLRCAAVLETHIHNDYVTGGLVLARASGAVYVLAGVEDVAFDHTAVADGDELVFGPIRVRVVATPGHTEGHVAYVVDDGEGPSLAFTGGSLLYGSVGRTDLVDPSKTAYLTRAQYRSARRLAALLDDETPVLPTHGFGSFCSSGATSSSNESTIGEERVHNEALTIDDEEAFVTGLLAGLSAYPSYYAHMGPRNREGPSPVDLSLPEPVDAQELERRIASGEWVVDLRSRTAFAAEHLGGTIGIALGQSFSTYIGWLIPWGTPLTLVGESPEQVGQAQRQLVRIGIDRPAGAAIGDPSALAGGRALRGYPRVTFAALAEESEAVVLDVRRADERAKARIPGSFHVPLHVLLDHLNELPGGTLWVHCASGFRASIAASLLDRAGRDVVLVDDDFANAPVVEVARTG